MDNFYNDSFISVIHDARAAKITDWELHGFLLELNGKNRDSKHKFGRKNIKEKIRKGKSAINPDSEVESD